MIICSVAIFSKIRNNIKFSFMIDISRSMSRYYDNKNMFILSRKFILFFLFLTKNPIRIIFYANDVLQDTHINNINDYENAFNLVLKRKNSFTSCMHENKIKKLKQKLNENDYRVVILDDITKNFVSKTFHSILSIR